MSGKTNRQYRFGSFLLDVEQKVLTRNGEIVRLSPKAFEIFALLAAKANTVVTKEELINSVWPDSFVEDANLTVHISVLRKVLNGDAAASIETLPKVGYRFVTVEERVVTTRDEESKPGRKPHIEWSGSRKLFWGVAIFGGLLFVGILLLLGSNPFGHGNTPPQPIVSVAVLLIENDSGDADWDYLSNGITEGLIRRLSQLPGLTVKSSRSISDVRQDTRNIGDKLSVQNVLSGRLDQENGKLSVTIELLDTTRDRSIWSDRFIANEFDETDLQNQVFEAVLKRFKPESSEEAQNHSLQSKTIDPNAYREYLKGRLLWRRRTTDDFKAAIEHFQKAINLDPDFALAYAGLADCYIQLPQWGGANPDDTIPQAKAAVLRALELDPELAEAHASLGQITTDFNDAEKEFKRAIELDPNYATAYQWYADLLYPVGRFDEARMFIRKAIELDPMSRMMRNSDGRISLFQRRYDEAIEIFKRNIVLDPTWEGDYDWLFHAYSAKGMYREAVEAHITAFTLAKQMNADEATALQVSFKRSGWNGFLKTRIEQLEERSRHNFIKPFMLAEFYARAGDKEKAFALLHSAVRTRADGTEYMKYLPSLDNLRSDPRFDELLKERGF